MKTVHWGVLGTAKIAVEKVIPAMQQGEYTFMEGIASRDEARAEKAANELEIPKSYGSYDELLKDQEIDAVYIPLPNHLHLPWSLKALEAGKHVLCEKPIALDADQAEELMRAAENYPDLKVMEAYMYRHHPQWKKVRELVQDGMIGDLQTIDTFFSYYNADPDDIRNQPQMGGGALMDIGCYPLSLSRFLFEEEPEQIYARMRKDPHLKIDYLTSAIMEFEQGTSTFTVSTQAARHQQVDIYGTKGRISLPLPFNPPTDHASRIFLHQGPDMEVLEFPVCNQYTIQGDLFSRVIRDEFEIPITLEDSHATMRAIDAVRHSAATKQHDESY
ncbi:MAG: Gfo/Idh/MocA family oxidoreductase [Balneolaceae bacterium]|nr:Gfo/Idh/MocA family oxidoreductase [Balneolaceae bacterium]